MKTKDATLQKVPYVGIIGDKEAEKGNSFSLRSNKGKDEGIITIDEFTSKILAKTI